MLYKKMLKDIYHGFIIFAIGLVIGGTIRDAIYQTADKQTRLQMQRDEFKSLILAIVITGVIMIPIIIFIG